jgi:hypothetical protein
VLQAHLDEPPPTLAPELDGFFARAMAKDREHRYATAGDLASDLRDGIAGGAPVTVRAQTPPVTRDDATQVIPRRRRRWPVVVALAVVAALVAGGAAIWATRDSGGSETNLAPFVDRVENVLTQSAAGRHEIARALNAARGCRISNADAAQRIDSVAGNRQSILQQLGSLTAPTPATDRMLTLLQQGLQNSIEADRHYGAGFRSSASCPPSKSQNFTMAAASDQRATTAKELFVARFDPLATRLHRRAWTAGEF